MSGPVEVSVQLHTSILGSIHSKDESFGQKKVDPFTNLHTQRLEAFLGPVNILGGKRESLKKFDL